MQVNARRLTDPTKPTTAPIGSDHLIAAVAMLARRAGAPLAARRLLGAGPKCAHTVATGGELGDTKCLRTPPVAAAAKSGADGARKPLKRRLEKGGSARRVASVGAAGSADAAPSGGGAAHDVAPGTQRVASSGAVGVADSVAGGANTSVAAEATIAAAPRGDTPAVAICESADAANYAAVDAARGAAPGGAAAAAVDAVDAEWEVVTGALRDEGKVLIYHMENHYCCVYGARSWSSASANVADGVQVRPDLQ